jgi:hypothetical protein
MRRASRGGTRFRAPSPKPVPADPLTCAGCGTPLQLGEEKARLEREARAAIEERLWDRLEPR